MYKPQNECFRCGHKITKLDPSLAECKDLGFNDYLCSWCYHQWEEHWSKN